jgi:hypothetical protein
MLFVMKINMEGAGRAILNVCKPGCLSLAR